MMGLLPPSVASALVGRWHQAGESHEKDVLVGYALMRLPPEADLDTARLILAEALSPAGEDFALEELSRLRLVTYDRRNLSACDLDLMLAAYLEECARFPADVIVAACRTPPRWKFWPELGPLLERIESLTEPRRQLERALDAGSVERAKARVEAASRRDAEAAQRQVAASAHLDECARDRGYADYSAMADVWARAHGYADFAAAARHRMTSLDVMRWSRAVEQLAAEEVKPEPTKPTSKRLEPIDPPSLPAEDDPRVQARLRDMGVAATDPAATDAERGLRPVGDTAERVVDQLAAGNAASPFRRGDGRDEP